MRTIAIDTETKSLKDKTIIAYSICIQGNDPIVEPVRMNTTKNGTIKDNIKYLQEFIQDKNNRIIFHNSSFDIPVLVQFGVPFETFEKASIEGRIEDTVIMANMVDENIQHGLKQLTKRYFKHQMAEYKEVCGTGKHQIDFADVPWDKAESYAGEDAYWTYKLYEYLEHRLYQDKPAWELYQQVEKPLLLVIADMHINGITIDMKRLKELTDLLKNKVDLLEEKLDITMHDINLNSPKQLREYFITKKHLPVLKTTNSGQASMDKEVLEIYAEKDSDAKMLLEYRKYNKVYTTFIPALTPTNWDLNTWLGKIYASFNQAGTSSGRFSSSNPNMQNIPTDSKTCEYCNEKLIKKDSKWICSKCGKKTNKIFIRECIVADKDQVIVGADYSQIELRVLAHVSQDFNLMKAYNEGQDIHKITAEACGVERRPAKTINFGLVYGMGAKKLAQRIEVSYEEANSYIERFFDKYPGVKEFWNDVKQQIEDKGYVRTCFGRKRRRTIYFDSKDDYDKGAEIRSITNAIIQGTSADMMKIAMVNMYPQLKKIGARIISTVHDEVIISTPKDKAKRAFAIIHRAMVDSGKSLSVSIEVDAKIGNNWDEVH